MLFLLSVNNIYNSTLAGTSVHSCLLMEEVMLKMGKR